MSHPGIPQHLHRLLLDYFESEPSIQKVILFGSRARLSHHHGSDVDLFIHLNSPSSHTTILSDLDDLKSLHSFDVQFADSPLSDVFLEQIRQEGILLYEKQGV